MSSKQWTYGLALALTVVTAAHATTFFVDADQGDDANSGLSAADPFGTIQWAIDAAAARPGADLIQIAAGEYYENLAISDADGLDIDDTQSIRLVNVTSTGNNDSGFDITAEEHFNIESVSIVGSEFSGNGADGIWIGEEGTVAEQVSLTAVTANDNGESGWDIHVSGPVKLSAVTAEGNGQPHVP